MKFFLPLATSQEQAQRVHARIANHLQQMGYQLTAHRTASLVCQREGKLVSYFVGAPTHKGEIILAIFSNEVSYLICTYSQGAVWGHPITVANSTVESVEDFDQADSTQ